MRSCAALLMVLLLLGGARAVEIPGKVVEVKGDFVHVKTSSKEAAKPNDLVEIFFEIPGLGEKALVATGKVTEVRQDAVLVKIERTPGKLAVGQMATIFSGGAKTTTSGSTNDDDRFIQEMDGLFMRMAEGSALFRKEAEDILRNKQADKQMLIDACDKFHKVLQKLETDAKALPGTGAAAGKVRDALQRIFKRMNFEMSEAIPHLVKSLSDRTTPVPTRLDDLRGLESQWMGSQPALLKEFDSALEEFEQGRPPGAISKIRLESLQIQNANNLKQIGLALHNYEATYRTWPTNIEKNGKPLLSWRVAILPYMEEDNLYRQFNLDEPWDSAHNRALAAKMPQVFRLPGTAKTTSVTHYQGFVGKGAFLEPGKKLKTIDLRDGSSNTIIVVEAQTPVLWTKPEDLPFDAGKPVPPLGALLQNGFHACFGDASVLLLPTDMNERLLRLLIDRDDGQPIPELPRLREPAIRRTKSPAKER